ncbi:MAG: DUF2177 family protein, partial [Parachlamydiaceae bacterium]
MNYFISLILLLALDAVWLGFMVNRFYKPNIEHLMGSSINFAAAAIFYLVYTFGVTYLITSESAEKPLWNIFLSGAVLGLTAYATYNLTNQATLKDWPTLVTIVDSTWGALLTGLVSVGTVWIAR